MYIHLTYDTDFDELILNLKAKYPKKLFDLDGIGKQTDLSRFSKDFFSNYDAAADVSIDANANVDNSSVITYNVELPKPLFKINSYYVMWKYIKKLFGHELANKCVEMQLTGDIYINDVHGIGGGLPYCFNYSCYDIMLMGLPMVNKIKSYPPKHLYAYKSQVEQFVVIASNSTLGATGLADLLVVMSYYVKNILNTLSDANFKFADEDSAWRYVKETLVSLIYTINQPMRGGQSPFSNISIYDNEFFNSLASGYVFPDGSTPDGDIVHRLQKLFLETMNEEMERTPITFPVTTACFSVDNENNIIDEKFADFISEQNLKYGFINIYAGKSSTLSSCCRLRSDIDNEYFNSFGSGSSKIGSLGVVTINLPKLAYIYKGNESTFFDKLKERVEICSKINHTKRHVVKKRIDNGNHPLYSFGFADLDKQYSTVGINGLNECCDILGYDITTDRGVEFVLNIMNVINSENDNMQKRYKAPHNCEQIPAENVSIKLADKDRLLGYNDEYNIYSNQFIPLTVKADMLDRIRLQGIFDKHFSGGAICHINIENQIDNVANMKNLIYHCAKVGVIYFACNYVLNECEEGHMTVGCSDTCSICGGKIKDKYTRVVGFLTNTKNWAKKRREVDFPNRQFY